VSTEVPSRLEASCAAHPALAAVASCRRCGDYVCSSCLAAGGVCTRCDERLNVLPWQERDELGFFRALLATLKLSLVDPKRYARASAHTATPGDALWFALLCCTVNVLLSAALLSPFVVVGIRAATARSSDPMPPWWSFAFAFAGAGLLAIVGFMSGSYGWALVLRLTTAASALSTRVDRLWCIVLYASGPLVAAWIPLAGILAPGYSMVLTVMGVHEASGGKSLLRSALAVIVPLGVGLVVAVSVYAGILYFALQQTSRAAS
jgi:hypothetical protein